MILGFPLLMFTYGMAMVVTSYVAPYLAPYTGETAGMFIPLGVMFGPLIAWLWIGYFRGRRTSDAAEFRARRAAAAEQSERPRFKDSTPRSDKPWQEQQHGHHIDTMPVEAPLSAIEHPPALPEADAIEPSRRR
jgi:hypothetical protein